jgi:hypothetical protein
LAPIHQCTIGATGDHAVWFCDQGLGRGNIPTFDGSNNAREQIMNRALVVSGNIVMNLWKNVECGFFRFLCTSETWRNSSGIRLFACAQKRRLGVRVLDGLLD